MQSARRLRFNEVHQPEPQGDIVADLIADAEYQEKPFIPAGYCPRHYIKTSNGMFDTPCPECEYEMEINAHG
jgi:hypothetical protein